MNAAVQNATTMQRDPMLEQAAAIAGLWWDDLREALGAHGLIEVQRQGATLADHATRSRYYYKVAHEAALVFALRRGKRPYGWNRKGVCSHCGPVWLPGDDDGAMERVSHCACCDHQPPSHGFDRPRVVCTDCKFFEPRQQPTWLHPIGYCSALKQEIPNAKPRYCPKWRSKDE